MNKPAGVVSTAREPGAAGGRELVDSPARLYPVGRLDADSTGLIVLTNDGALANRLMHPRYEVPKTYRARLAKAPRERDLARLRDGVELEDGPTAPAKVKKVGDLEIEIVLREGRNRQVRRMVEAVGNKVVSLQRIGFGPLRLGGSPREARGASVGQRSPNSARPGRSSPRHPGAPLDALGPSPAAPTRFGSPRTPPPVPVRLRARSRGERRSPRRGVPGRVSVPLEGDLDRVVASTVGLDHEFLLRPEEIDLEHPLRRAHLGVDLRIGSPAAARSGNSLASKRLRIVEYLAVSATGRHSSRTVRSVGAPRRRGPFASTASTAAISSAFRVAAISTASRTFSIPLPPAESTKVRATVVHGIP